MPLQETPPNVISSKSPIKKIVTNERKRGPTTPIKPIYNPTSKRRIEELPPSWDLEKENCHHIQSSIQLLLEKIQLHPEVPNHNSSKVINVNMIIRSEANYQINLEQKRTKYYKSLVKFMELERELQNQ